MFALHFVMIFAVSGTLLAPFHIRHVLKENKQVILLATIPTYLNDQCALATLQYAANMAKVSNNTVKRTILTIPNFLKEYKQFSRTFTNTCLIDEDFKSLYKTRFGSTTALKLDKVVALELHYNYEVCIQIIRAASNEFASHPSGFESLEKLQATLKIGDTCDRFLEMHINALLSLHPAVDYSSWEFIQKIAKVYSEAKTHFKKRSQLFTSTNLISFYTLASVHEKQYSSHHLESLPFTVNADSNQRPVIGLPIPLEFGLRVHYSWSTDRMEQFKNYQNSIIELLETKQRDIYRKQSELLNKVLDNVPKNDIVGDAVSLWLKSWTTLALSGLYPNYLPSPNSHPLNFTPLKHFEFFCQSMQSFLKNTLRPYINSCIKQGRSQAINLLKQSLQASVAIGRVVTTMPMFMMQGVDHIKSMNAPLDALVRDYLNLIKSFSL